MEMIALKNSANSGHHCSMPYLISFSGLPGVGKTTIAKALCRRFPATFVRVDVIEAALKASALGLEQVEDAGYHAAAALAKSNLELGNDVIADTVNPVRASRELWSQTAEAGDAKLLNVEIVCSDEKIHRIRVETRSNDIESLTMPSWQQVLDRTYDPWSEEFLRLDSALISVEDAVDTILNTISRM